MKTVFDTNPVGRFMVAGGAVIELLNSGKILIQKRSSTQDWQSNEWEIPYGRVAQFEDVFTGFRREIKEETGLSDVEILKPIRIWHTFRGSEKTAASEMIGITFHCQTNQKKVVCSREHCDYRWVTPKEALRIIKIEGIRMDIEALLKQKKDGEKNIF